MNETTQYTENWQVILKVLYTYEQKITNMLKETNSGVDFSYTPIVERTAAGNYKLTNTDESAPPTIEQTSTVMDAIKIFTELFDRS